MKPSTLAAGQFAGHVSKVDCKRLPDNNIMREYTFETQSAISLMYDTNTIGPGIVWKVSDTENVLLLTD